MNIERVMHELGKLFQQRRHDEIEDFLSVNLENALKEGDTGAAISIINELIGFYRDTSQYDKAEAYCEKLLPFMEKAGLKDTVHYGTSCLNIANAYRASGKLDKSKAYYDMCIDIYQKTIEPFDMLYASLHNNLSLLYQEMGEYENAADELKKALEVVKLHPEKKIELGVTHSNLAASLVKLGKLEEAKQHAGLATAIFTGDLKGDFHQTGVLSVQGDVCFANGEYSKAVACYESAMILLRSHVGLTHGYLRIVEKLQNTYEKLGRPDTLKGLTIARDYYEQYGRDIFAGTIGMGAAIGKVGEGSECFGFDDIYSIDHDFGPGFSIFVTRKQYEDMGEELINAYNKLPLTFRGFERQPVNYENPRHGVIVVEDFVCRILGITEEEFDYLKVNYTLEADVWLRIEDWRLRTLTNGELFDGRQSVFGKIYTRLKQGYPENIRRRKMAQTLGFICQEGQYNYERMMKRHDAASATLLLHQFILHTLELLYLINNKYAPHEKWMMKGASGLEKGAEIYTKITKLSGMSPDVSVYETRQPIDWVGIRNEDDEVLKAIFKITDEICKLLRKEDLSESEDYYLEAHIPYLLR